MLQTIDETRRRRLHPTKKMMLRHQCVSACILTLFLTAVRGENLRDIEYGRAGKYILRLDAHIPAGAGPFAAVILVHGGAWVAGTESTTFNRSFSRYPMRGLRGFRSATGSRAMWHAIRLERPCNWEPPRMTFAGQWRS